MPKGSNYMGRP
jgi:hypothetical protein